MTVNFQQIPYGGTYLGYAFGKDGAELVYSKGLCFANNIASSISDEGVLDQIRLFHASVGKHPKNAIFCAEISPSPEESKGWTNDDFRNIAIELLTEIDKQELRDKKGKLLTKRTTLMNSMCAIVKHVDSKSGIIHLHAMISTIDLDGNAIPQHKIAERAIAACDVVNARHRWKQPKEIRAEHLEEINSNIDLELHSMKNWDWNTFVNALHKYGYEIKEKHDSNGQLVNYSLLRGNSKFKASELGKNNCYTVAHIERTWKALHKIENIQRTTNSNDSSSVSHPSRSSQLIEQVQFENNSNISSPNTCITRNLNIGGRHKHVSIPQTIYDIFKDNCQVPVENTIAKQNDVIDTAIMLFVGYVDAATTYIESHGGGNSPTEDWGRKKDEDDWRFAHRCAKLANSMMKHKVSRGRGR